MSLLHASPFPDASCCCTASPLLSKAQRWGYHSVVAENRRRGPSHGRVSTRAIPSRSLLSTLGVRSRLCVVSVHSPVQPPPAEVLEAVEEFESAFGMVYLPSGAKRIYRLVHGHCATAGVSLDALCADPSTPDEARIR